MKPCKTARELQIQPDWAARTLVRNSSQDRIICTCKYPTFLELNWRTAIPTRLAEAAIEPVGADYLIRFASQDGVSFELLATFDQLDQLAEEIDRRLDADEQGHG